jgi:uncharacterized protein (DUF697 family)
MNDQMIGNYSREIWKGFIDMELFGNGTKAHELSNLIKQHSIAGFASGFIPVPGLDLAALVANTWTMYVRINNVVGISFSDNALKSIASGVFANLVSVIPSIAVLLGVETALKFIPGIGTLGGMAIGAAGNVAVTYVAGKVYLKSLEVLIHSGKPITEENIKKVTEQTSKDKAFVKNAYAEGKEVAKNR